VSLQWAKSPKKQSVGVFLTTWHCILSAEFYKNALPRTVFLAILPTGCNDLLLNSYRQRSIAVERHTYFQLPIINHTYQIIQANAHTWCVEWMVAGIEPSTFRFLSDYYYTVWLNQWTTIQPLKVEWKWLI